MTTCPTTEDEREAAKDIIRTLERRLEGFKRAARGVEQEISGIKHAYGLTSWVDSTSKRATIDKQARQSVE